MNLFRKDITLGELNQFGIRVESQTTKLLLEKYEDVALALGIDLLSKEFKRQTLIRLRRGGDNVEANFTKSEINDGTVTAWKSEGLGDGNAYVRKWVDQSGNGYDLEQATAGSQPLFDETVPAIVSSLLPSLALGTLSTSLPSSISGTMIEVFEDGAIHYEVEVPTNYTRSMLRSPKGWQTTIIFSRTLSESERNAVIDDLDGVSLSAWATKQRFDFAWQLRSDIVSFPNLDYSGATNLSNTWEDCVNLQSLTLTNIGNVTNVRNALNGCSSLTSNPLYPIPAGVNSLRGILYGCSNITTFQNDLVTSNITDLYEAFAYTGITAIPSAWDFSSIINMSSAFANSPNLTAIPPNMFDDCPAHEFSYTFAGCALTVQSIENLLVSLDTSGNTDGALGIQGGTNAGKSTWTSAANTAYDNLVAKGWIISENA